LLFSASTSVSSLRLSFEWFLVTRQETLADHEAGIAISVASHRTRRAEAERRAWSVALDRLPFGVTYDEGVTAMAFSGRVARVDSAGEDLSVPRFILGVLENPPFHPERSLRVPPAAILALFRAEVPQVFKHEDGSPLLCGELDNASAHQMGKVLIGVADLAPEIGIVLFVLCNDARL
jgi:hypothetical protein